MPIPVKPCDGRFSDELQLALAQNIDRAQWNTHACEVCGVLVGAVQVGGKWVPEQHWPSVKYPVRNAQDKKRYASASRHQSAVPAETVSQ